MRRAQRPASASRGLSRARPRHARLAAASSALAITLVTLLGGMGLVPVGADASASGNASTEPSAELTPVTIPDEASPTPTEVATKPEPATVALPNEALPTESGTGKRVVFDVSDQRVWLVEDGDDVVRTYLVSGSLTDNVKPGTYAIYSRSRWAAGIDDSGVMQYFARFTRGVNAAIGFHAIPTKDGRPLQTTAQLGTPRSHGCIRQALPDARKLWRFAPVGTKVVVTA